MKLLKESRRLKSTMVSKALAKGLWGSNKQARFNKFCLDKRA